MEDDVAVVASVKTKKCSKKDCSRAGQELPLTEFYLKGSSPTSWCKKCTIIHSKKWRAKNPERVRAATRRWAEKNPEKRMAISRNWRARNSEREATRLRVSNWLKKYGKTEEDYYSVLLAQNGGCAICRSTDPGRGAKYFCWDHNHDNGVVRGLLCGDCNAGIVWLDGDSVDHLSIICRALKHLGVSFPPTVENENSS